MHPALGKSSIGEFTRAEFLAFVDDLVHARGGSEAENNAWVNHFDRLVAPHPAGTDLLFWPAPGADDSPEGITATVEEYVRSHGLLGFRDG